MKVTKRLIILVFILQACGGGDDGPPPPPPLVIGSFDLTFPDNNEICTEGTSISDDMISIPFRWTAAENATSYRIEVTESQGTQTYEAMVTTNSGDITLPKGTQFRWKVIALLNNDMRDSDDTWNFYSEGIAEDSHIPFPATITLQDNQDGTINISWTGSDLDDDIDGYDVHLGTTDNPPAILSNTQDISIQNQTITYNTVYFLEVITKDLKGNSSISKKKFNFRN